MFVKLCSHQLILVYMVCISQHHKYTGKHHFNGFTSRSVVGIPCIKCVSSCFSVRAVNPMVYDSCSFFCCLLQYISGKRIILSKDIKHLKDLVIFCRLTFQKIYSSSSFQLYAKEHLQILRVTPNTSEIMVDSGNLIAKKYYLNVVLLFGFFFWYP